MAHKFKSPKANETRSDKRQKAASLTEPPIASLKSKAEIVSEFAANYAQLKPTLPQGEIIEKEVLMAAGVLGVDGAPEFNYTLVAIPLDSPEISMVGSTCGQVNNRVFSNKSIVSFLKNRQVTHVLGVIVGDMLDTLQTRHDGELVLNAMAGLCTPEFPRLSEVEKQDQETISLSAIALPMAGREGHMFESFVRKSKGSFRYEHSGVSGWSVYESE